MRWPTRGSSLRSVPLSGSTASGLGVEYVCQQHEAERIARHIQGVDSHVPS